MRQRYANGLRAIALQQAGRETALIQILIRTDTPDAFPAGTDEITARMLFTTTRNETLHTMGYRLALSGGALQIFWEPNLTQNRRLRPPERAGECVIYPRRGADTLRV